MQLLSTGLFYIGGSVLLSLLSMWLVRRFAPFQVMEGHKEIAGFIYGVLGTIYAVILGFSVVVLWEQFHDAEIIADREASQLSDLHRLAQGLPADQQDAFALSLEKYCKLVINEEWPLMDNGKPSPKAHDQLLEIWRKGQGLDPQTEREQIIFGKIVDALAELDDARRGRLLAARSSLPKPLWFVLIAGAVVTIGFSFLFGLKNVIAHTVITTLLAASIGLGLFIIAALEGPFSGSLRLSPDAFTAVLESWDRTPLSATAPK
ncbi:MAG: hypothetical protein V7609_3474 [Verrucomicrobiota bacterium]